MAWRKDGYLTSDGARIVCHGHGAQFDMESGICISGPCEGQSLQSLELQIDETGYVYVNLENLSENSINKNNTAIVEP